MVLFERDAGQLRYQVGDDDSGEDRNATLQLKLSRPRVRAADPPLLQPGVGRDRRHALVSR
jgi:hypothetical protein